MMMAIMVAMATEATLQLLNMALPLLELLPPSRTLAKAPL
jgi:hypothetical protein